MKDQPHKKGKNPHFGIEHCLYRIQEQLLEVIGPYLACGQTHTILIPMPTKEETIPLLQRMLVLVSSMNNFINIEGRRTACSSINPLLKPLAEKKCKKHKGNLFGPDFLERASKKMTDEKAMVKVANNAQGSHKWVFKEGPSGGSIRFLSFLSRGALTAAKENSTNRTHTNQPTKDHFKKPCSAHH